MREEYQVKIEKASAEFSGKQAVMLKDLSDAVSFDAATQEGPVAIKPVAWAVLATHNEKAKDNKDYYNYVILTEDGGKYKTGSDNFFNSFMDIWEEMHGSDEEWAVKVYRKPSKNYQGKEFITCSVI